MLYLFVTVTKPVTAHSYKGHTYRDNELAVVSKCYQCEWTWNYSFVDFWVIKYSQESTKHLLSYL